MHIENTDCKTRFFYDINVLNYEKAGDCPSTVNKFSTVAIKANDMDNATISRVRHVTNVSRLLFTLQTSSLLSKGFRFKFNQSGFSFGQVNPAKTFSEPDSKLHQSIIMSNPFAVYLSLIILKFIQYRICRHYEKQCLFLV